MSDITIEFSDGGDIILEMAESPMPGGGGGSGTPTEYFAGKGIKIDGNTIALSEEEFTAADEAKLDSLTRIPDQVSSAEKTAGTVTDERMFSPKDVADMVSEHETDHLTDQQIGEKAFDNVPTDLTSTEKTTIKSRIGVTDGVNLTGGTGITISNDTVSLSDERFTSAEKSKLSGIEANAQKNPPHSVKFSAQDGNTADSVADGVWGLIKADGTQWQGGNQAEITSIDIPFNAGIFNTDVTSLGVSLDAVNLRPLFDDAADGNGAVLLGQNRRGDDHLSYVQMESVTKHSDHYTLSEPTWVNAKVFGPGEGYAWNIAAGITSGSLSKDIADLNTVLSAYATKQELAGSETDRFASYNNSFVQGSYRAGFWVLTSDTSGAPTQANQIGQPNIATGSGTVCFGRLRTDADPNDLQWDVVPAASLYSNGDIFYASIDGDKSAHLKITLTADGTLVGSGTAAYVYATASWIETGNVADVQDFGDYFRIGRDVPSKLQIELPFTDILGAPWVRGDGTEMTDADVSNDTDLVTSDSRRLSVGELYEHHDQNHTGLTTLSGYEFQTGTATPDAGDVAAPAPLQGQSTGNYYIKALNDADKALIKDAIIADKRVQFQVSDTRYIEFRPTGVPGELFGRLFGNFAASSYTTVGATIGDDTAVSIRIESNIAARDEFAAVAFTGDYDDLNNALPNAPANASEAKDYKLNVPQTSGDATWVEDTAAGGDTLEHKATNTPSNNAWADISDDVYNSNDILLIGNSEHSSNITDGEEAVSCALIRYGDIRPSPNSTRIYGIGSIRRTSDNKLQGNSSTKSKKYTVYKIG